MKGKKTIIISSLIMCVTLIVAIVSVTAAWFGNVTSGKIEADLTIDSDTVDESANVEIDSSATGAGNDICPAIAVKGLVGSAYPGNYGLVEGKEYNKEDAEKLYPSSDSPVDSNISKNAQVATIYLTIDYIGSIDEGASDGKKTLLMSLDGVYLSAAFGDKPNYEDTSLVNYKEEFNVKMSLVKNIGSAEDPQFVEDETLNSDVHNDYNEKNPYGQLMYFRVAPGKYTVKFEIYFNKVDEECNFDLLNTTLSLRIKLSKDVSPWTDWDSIGKEGA